MMMKISGLRVAMFAGAAVLVLAGGPVVAASKVAPSDKALCEFIPDAEPAAGWEAACRRLVAGPDTTEAAFAHIQIGSRSLFGDNEAALREAEVALKLAPASTEALRLRAYALLQLMRYPETKAAFETLLQRQPNEMGAHEVLGDIARRQGDFVTAEREYDAAIAADSELAEAYFWRGWVREEQRKLDGALADYDRAVRLAPDKSAYAQNWVLLLAKLGRTDEALKNATSLLKAKPAELFSLRAIVHRSMGDYAASLSDVEAALAAGDDTALVREMQATLLLDFGRNEEALAVAAQAAARWPDDRNLQRILARSQVFAHKDEALASLTRMLAADESNAEAHYLRGLHYGQKDDLPKALADFDLAVRLEPRSAVYVVARGMVYARQGERDKALSDYDTAMRLAPDDVSIAVEKADLVYDAKAPQAALAVLDAALRIDPAYADALRKRAWLYGHQGDWARGLADMDAAAKAAPQDPDVLRDVALYHVRTGDYAGAKPLLDRVLRLEPDNVAALKDRAFLLGQEGRYALALQDFDRAVELSRADAQLLVDRAEMRLAVKDEAGALRDYAAALALDGRYAPALASRAQLYRGKGAYDLAQADIDQALAIKPDNADVLYDRAVIHLEQGQYDRAIRDLNAALRLAPGDAYALAAKGDAYRHLQDHAQAVEYYDQSIAALPTAAETWWRRGLSKAAMGDKPGAAADQAQARKLNPKIEKLEG